MAVVVFQQQYFELGVVTSTFWGSYITYFYTIGERIPYFPTLGFVNIQYWNFETFTK